MGKRSYEGAVSPVLPFDDTTDDVTVEREIELSGFGPIGQIMIFI